VDTQGLNQIFPVEVRKLAETCDAKTTEERLQHWFESTSRGKHLEWQFRRCDAVLWVVHARKANSAVSRAAMSYFKRYGKVSVLVVTHIDQIPDDGSSRERILARFRDTMGDDVAAIRAVDARKAAQGVLDDDEEARRTSGLTELMGTLHDLCIRRGRIVRGIGLYNSVRQTQREQYMAVSTLHERFQRTIALLEWHRKCVSDFADKSVTSIQASHKRAISDGLSDLRRAAGRVKFADKKYVIMQKLRPDLARDKYHAAIRSAYAAIRGEAETLTRKLNEETFDLPSFGADGRAAGVSVQAQARQRTLDIRVPEVSLDLSLKWRLIEKGKIVLLDTFWKEKAEQMREKAEREKRSEVRGFVVKAWSQFDGECQKKLESPIRKLARDLAEEIDRIQVELEKAEGRPLQTSLTRIGEARKQLAVPPIYAATMLQALRAAAHKGSETHG